MPNAANDAGMMLLDNLIGFGGTVETSMKHMLGHDAGDEFCTWLSHC